MVLEPTTPPFHHPSLRYTDKTMIQQTLPLFAFYDSWLFSEAELLHVYANAQRDQFLDGVPMYFSKEQFEKRRRFEALEGAVYTRMRELPAPFCIGDRVHALKHLTGSVFQSGTRPDELSRGRSYPVRDMFYIVKPGTKENVIQDRYAQPKHGWHIILETGSSNPQSWHASCFSTVSLRRLIHASTLVFPFNQRVARGWSWMTHGLSA
jgi:hypothetical protein